VALSGLLLAACGSEKISVAQTDPTYRGAELFSQRCGGCHTLTPAGTQGSDGRSIRAQGPNLDQRAETKSDVLFAIRNGGYSGAIMPQNIVTGKDAQAVAAFVAKYAGTKSVSSPRPGETCPPNAPCPATPGQTATTP
jgi:mono/diheme cytochrome c family protein